MICDNTKCPHWKAFDANCEAADGCAGYSSLIFNNQAVVDEIGIVCENCRVGSNMCSVKTRYGWCCDVCLEPELLWMKSIGVHTVNSCCGHGDKNFATIIVVGQSSIDKLTELGYEKINYEWDVKPLNSSAVFRAKTVLLYENWGKNNE